MDPTGFEPVTYPTRSDSRQFELITGMDPTGFEPVTSSV